MKYIWRLVKSIENEHRQRSTFLALNACVWGLLAFLVFIPPGIFFNGPDEGLILALCAAGYGSILVGIYGGIFYLYKRE